VHVPKQNVEQIEKRAVKPKALKRPAKKRKREAPEGETGEEQAQKKLKSE